MSVRMRHTRAHTGNRRSHHALSIPRLSKCTTCGDWHLRHRLCEACGTYRGKTLRDLTSKLAKKEKKRKERENSAAQ